MQPLTVFVLPQPLTVFVLPEQVTQGIFTPMFAYLYSEIIKYFYMQSM